MGKSYDPNEDYKKKMDEAAAVGDYEAAARYEQQRNAKIQGEGLTQYQTTNQYGQYLPMEKPAVPRQTWQGEMQQTLQDILNRKPFSYDVNADALYQQYAQQYAQQGRLAMEDTMGKAAALTGGYGNSYAQSVGQQTYNDYMGRLNDMVPELEQRAYQRYQAEGDALLDRYSLMQNAQDREYSRYQDQLTEYYNQLDRREAKEGDERDRAYSLALQMLQTGMMPSDALLSLSGISAEDAQKIMDGNTVSYSGSYGGGSGSGASGASGAEEAEKEALSNKDWSALFQLYQKGAKSGDLTAYYSELANYARQYNVKEFEDYMEGHVTGYRRQGNQATNDGTINVQGRKVNYEDIKRTVKYSTASRFNEIMAEYEDYLTDEQMAELAKIYAMRGL